MTGFILNGLSESLLSSRLFRIKAWVLQVPFLSMIFLYFFDHSNLNHSKVFYWFLYIFHSFAVSLSSSDLSRILHHLIYTMYISRDFHSFTLSILHSDTLLLVPFRTKLGPFFALPVPLAWCFFEINRSISSSMLGGVSYSFVISSIYIRYYPSIYLTSFTCTRPSIYLSILDFNHSIILIMSHSPSPNSLIPSLQMTEYLLIFFISLCLLPRHSMSVIVFCMRFLRLFALIR